MIVFPSLLSFHHTNVLPGSFSPWLLSSCFHTSVHSGDCGVTREYNDDELAPSGDSNTNWSSSLWLARTSNDIDDLVVRIKFWQPSSIGWSLWWLCRMLGVQLSSWTSWSLGLFEESGLKPCWPPPPFWHTVNSSLLQLCSSVWLLVAFTWGNMSESNQSLQHLTWPCISKWTCYILDIS